MSALATRTRPIVLAAGGTGGHMFPALALAEELIARGRSVLLATDARGADYGKRVEGLERRVVPSASPSRGGLIGKGMFAITMARGALAASRLLRSVRAAGAVGFGGYASFPACFMAARQGRPVVLHEQNGYLGLANRKLARQVAALALSFRDVAGIPETEARQVLTGNPVRPDFIALHGRPYDAPVPGGPLNILVLGGSQGARVFSEILPAAIEALPEADRARLSLVQQCRPEDIDTVREIYARTGVTAVLESFFDDIPDRMAGAHLVISRAGASTVSEVLTAGRPAILVPYPHAADDHQTYNARSVEAAGAGWLMANDDFTAEAVAARLGALLSDPSRLAPVAAKAADAALPDAARRLADLVEDIIPNEEARA